MTSQDQEVKKECLIEVQRVVGQADWYFDLEAQPDFSKWPIRMRIKKAELKGKILADITNMARAGATGDDTVPFEAWATLKRGKIKDNATDPNKEWSYFWDIEGFMDVPPAPTHTKNPTGGTATTQGPFEKRHMIDQLGMNSRTALMQGVQYANITGSQDAQETLQITQMFKEWLDSQTMPLFSNLASAAMDAGAVPVKISPESESGPIGDLIRLHNVPDMGTHEDVTNFLDSKGIKVRDIQWILGQQGYEDSGQFMDKNRTGRKGLTAYILDEFMRQNRQGNLEAQNGAR
jgi:hypothetical protein